jgi:hypothetical protein
LVPAIVELLGRIHENVHGHLVIILGGIFLDSDCLHTPKVVHGIGWWEWFILNWMDGNEGDGIGLGGGRKGGTEVNVLR